MALSREQQPLVDLLRSAVESRRAVIFLGVGNSLRADDGVGCLLAEQLASMALPGLDAWNVEMALENASHFFSREPTGAFIIVDAVWDEHLTPGVWGMWPPDTLDSFCHTTHSVPISLLLKLWGQDYPNATILFIGVAIGCNTMFADMTPEVIAAKNDIIRHVVDIFSIANST